MGIVTLDPRLVITSGLSATGKSTTLEEVARRISNSFILEKDAINQSMLHVVPTEDLRLLPFDEYVKGDSVFPDHARNVETPFGEMIKIDPANGYYGRHARDQTYIVMANIAYGNMKNGKVPLLDCIVIRQIRDGTVKKFMDQPMLADYPKYLIHFVTGEEECYQRHLARAKTNPEAAIRDAKKISSRDAFHRFVTEEQPMTPEELKKYDHLILDTSKRSPAECAREFIEYISN
ncbi:MAG: hypothetical protein Q8Q31_03275 [Nanoarchaeota archaeon]|nr:hypothetical protein [Nanoarchaeota archaeon]